MVSPVPHTVSTCLQRVRMNPAHPREDHSRRHDAASRSGGISNSSTGHREARYKVLGSTTIDRAFMLASKGPAKGPR